MAKGGPALDGGAKLLSDTRVVAAEIAATIPAVLAFAADAPAQTPALSSELTLALSGVMADAAILRQEADA